MSNDRPAPRDPVRGNRRAHDETDETISDDPAYDDPAYDPAKQAPVEEGSEDAVHDMVDVEHQEDVSYDLEDETS